MTITSGDAVLGTSNRPFTVEGTYNLRTTAGYPAQGRVVRDGKLFRSDGLQGLTEAGRTQFALFGIRRVIDLRDRTELDNFPSQLHGLPLEVSHNPIFEDGKVPGAAETTTLQSIYRLMIEQHAQRLADAVRIIADSRTDPVLVHCAAGKDRTGLVIALALLAAGVERDYVVSDYAASEENLTGEWTEKMLAAVVTSHGLASVEEGLREIITASPAAVLEATLDLIEASYGSATGLLKSHGFSDDDVARLREVLTVAPETTSTTT
ncbi:tyrosine-protein phosphatase [Pseudarthrobacter oxydans]|uniref:tyrosine-protein phosphatase n=1 Tax=Pseudarthrobacter oxydans TaxID=1671 RepID=UPI00342ED9CC